MPPPLPSLISLRRPENGPPEPEDIFGSSLGGIFTDDLQNSYGDDPDTTIIYKSHRFGDLEFAAADVRGEEQRRKFAHYLWNAGILMAELVAGRVEEGKVEGVVDGEAKDGENGVFGAGKMGHGEDEWGKEKWWVSKEEEQLWSVQGQTVLELGAELYAGVGLAGIASALSGAAEVTITDYPAPPILSAITTNVSKNLPGHIKSHVTIHGHSWGDLSTPFAIENAHRFTRILAADCLWMSDQHDNLAQSMLHFLSESPDARVYCIAGFHTGRTRLAPFFQEVAPESGLEIEEIYEMDGMGKCRVWVNEKSGVEDIGERNKWLVVARLKRQGS
ncbi:hypothetical protein K504DRAFT_128687 [Pleomassaria siparia CBS 279.74]|uniref:Nicotinamide N-methyltransferase n=1 Tax=Pleomassaria siparia CBS 279.74 TaxID=1314801 RepID=A0A6G1KJN1_9PLEO|nr:hypothetical protein K504DRAFT_128687 [Pleomassaria siparia CBS 279.74]